jgi:hypothetical protein
MITIGKVLKHAILLGMTGTMLLTGACATSFTGSAYVESGRAGCEAKCKGEGMEFVGMVYMGEYSDACVCGAPGRAASNLSHGVASVGAGATGVVLQRRRQQEQAQQASANN